MGPSGMTAEHLKPMLESGADTLLCNVAGGFARGDVPKKWSTRVASQRSRGKARRIVFPRVVTRTTAKQFSARDEAATGPFQFALSTRPWLRMRDARHPKCHRHQRQDNHCVSGRNRRKRFDFTRNNMFPGLCRLVDGYQMIPFHDVVLRNTIGPLVGRQHGKHL